MASRSNAAGPAGKREEAASGTATTRSAGRSNQSIASRRTASLGVITMVARPNRNSMGVRLRMRSAWACQRLSFQGDTSWMVMMVGRIGKYGTAKSVP